MPDDDRPPSSDEPEPRSWFGRLIDAISGEPQDIDELRNLLRDAERRALIDDNALTMIEGVLEVSDSKVRDVMVPRSHMVVIDRDQQTVEILSVIVESGHSRFPVIGEDRDEVVGTLLAKDLLRYVAEGAPASFDIRECLRPVMHVPESKRLDILLKEFRARRNHMAIVVDEYGGTAGLVTIEDVLEEIVGEIDDEHDVQEEAVIVDEGHGRYSVHALTPVDDFNVYFGSEFSDDDFDTLGGLVMHAFGRLPRSGESVALGTFAIRVLRADRRRIHALEVTRAVVTKVEQESSAE